MVYCQKKRGLAGERVVLDAKPKVAAAIAKNGGWTVVFNPCRYIGLCGLGLLPDIGGVGAEEAGCSGGGATSGWAHSKGLDGYGVWADEIDGCPDLGVAKPP